MKNFIGIEILNKTELAELISEVFRMEFQALAPLINENVKYLTRKEVASVLQVSLPTVSKWANQGIIQKHRIGSRIYFEKSQVMKAVKMVQNVKYQRNHLINNQLADLL